jgi:hypothetical protein
MKNIYNREIKQNEKLMHVGIAGKLLIIASRFTQKANKKILKFFFHPFKVRKCQKEALKAPGRHDSMNHPIPKFYGETLLWVHTSSQNFRSIQLS